MRFKKIFADILVKSAFPALTGCASATFPTVPNVDLARYMGTWYVSAGRFTMFERDVTNAVEIYKYDDQSKTIGIDFTYRKGSADGKEKSIPQKGWVVEGSQNAHWRVSPFWPLKFDYLIIALAEDYSWVAVGVPDQKYLWIMHRKKQASREQVDEVIRRLKAINYDINGIETVPQAWPSN